MTNAVGGNIKVTLTLDDAGFSVKTRQARDNVKGMSSEFGRAAKAVEGFETKIGTLGKNVSLVSNSMKSLQASSKSLETQFATAGKSMSAFNTSAALASKNSELLNGVVLKLARLLDGASTETNRATKANERLAVSQREVATAAQSTVNGLTAQERAMRNLGASHALVARQVVLAAGLRKNDAAQAAAAEINANNKSIASKKATMNSMLRTEREYQASLNAERAKAMALQMQMENRRGTNGRMMGANSPELIQRNALLQRELTLTNQRIAGLQRGLTLIGQESMKLNQSLNSLNNINRVQQNRLSLEGRIEQALQRQNQRALDYQRTQRETAAKAKEQLETSRQQMEMIKGMAQLYSSAKIIQGEKAAIKSAGEFERTGVRTKAMGLNQQELKEFNYMVEYDSKSHPGLSFNDAATARIGAMGGLASKNQRQINQTLPTAIDAAQNIQYITGDDGHESFENYIRNLYGVAEARQVQYNPEKTKKTFEMLQKIIAATGNKIDIPDIETLLRRIGPGGAAQLSDDGIINMVAMLDQMKVSGGGGGGGAGGVSTVGTMFKMLQAYANGKTMSNEMVAQAAAAGILNTDAISTGKNDGDPNKEGIAADTSLKAVMAQAKKAGFKNSQLFNTDPVSAIREMMATVLGTISNEVNRKKYFGDADVNDPEAQRTALSKWVNRNGTTTTTSQMLMTIADARMQERVDHQSDMVKGSGGVDEVKQLRMDTYEQQVKNFDAAMANLKVTLGTSVLPLMTDFFEWLTKIINKMQDFGKENPMVAQLVMIGGAIGGVVLGIAGMTKLFGIVGGLRGLLFGAAAGAGEAGAKAGLLARGLNLVITPVKWLLTGLAFLNTSVITPLLGTLTRFVTGLGFVGTAISAVRGFFAAALGPIVAWGARLLGVGTSFTGLGAVIARVAGLIGKVFLRLIPYVGWLVLAWDLTDLILNFQVGFATIGEWMDNWMARMINGAEVFAAKFRNKFRFGEESQAEGDARLAQLAKEAEVEETNFQAKRDANKKIQEEEDKAKEQRRKKEAEEQAQRKSALEMNDAEMKAFINGEGFTHTDKAAETNTNNTPFNLPPPKTPKAPREPRTPRDQFARSLAEVTSKQEVTAMRITAQITGRADNLLEQARTEFFEKWKAGDFDPDHDSKKRPFKGANGGLDWNAKGASGDVQQWIDTRAAMLQQEEQLKGLTYANERVAASREDANTAMERGTEDTAKQTREMAGLVRELARTEERLKNGTKEFTAWGAKKNEALFERSRADLVNYTADFTESDRETANGMIYNTREREGAKFDTKAQKDLETYNLRLAEMAKNYEAARVAAVKLGEEGGTTAEETASKLKMLDDEFNEARTRAETTFTEHVKIQANAREYAMRGAIEKMQLDWENAFDKMDEVTANWGNTFLSNLSTVLTGGSVEWKSFLASMLKDLLDMKLKEALAKPVSSLLDAAGNGLTGMLSANKAPAQQGVQSFGTAAGNALAGNGGGIMSSLGNAASAAGGAIKGGLQSAASLFGLDKLGGAADVAKESISKMTSDGVNQATAGLVTQVAQQGVTLATETTAQAATATLILAFQGLNAATIQLAASMVSAATSSTVGAAFANGGIMSSAGSLPLKAYANGGIANKPQLALFGEGRMNEAYVPLPDGRSIPVSFSGDSMGDASTGGVYAPVNIKIVINNDGTESTEVNDESGQRQDAAEMAGKIKAIVRETLIKETRPNGILDKRK